MQSNQNNNIDDFNIIDKDVWDILYTLIQQKPILPTLISHVNNISIKYNIDKKNIIKDFLNYIIRNKTNDINNNNDFYYFIENILHFEDCNNTYYVNYSLLRISSLIKEL